QAGAAGDALLLPQDLLVTKLNENGVYIVGKDSVAHWRPLELGSIVGSQVEVLGGVARGERIVTVGMRSLSEGDKVIVARQGVCCKRGTVVFDAPATSPSAAASAASAANATPEPEASTTEGKPAK